ncbi:MAG: alpha/beta hydrolase [Ignisphaera sp.]|uniref:Alpha/beta hydrolase n=1 Tax=Ignisphaera aggregans TaxID=334771 RepID=A0A7C4JJX0_9CREN
MLGIQDIVIEGREAKIPLRIYKPFERKTKGIVVYYHWGGFVAGSIDESDAECRSLVTNCGCTVVSVGYRLAPKHKFPAAVVDSFDALKWVYENAEELGGDKESICVMGVSAGGNLAAVVSLLARDNGIKLRCQVLVTPVIGFDPFSESARLYGEKGCRLSMDTIVDFTLKYLGNLKEAFNPLFTPILSDLSGLPPALIITAEKDALRDQGEAYAKRLSDYGVPVISIRVNGIEHTIGGIQGKFIFLIASAFIKEKLEQE